MELVVVSLFQNRKEKCHKKVTKDYRSKTKKDKNEKGENFQTTKWDKKQMTFREKIKLN